MLNTCHIRPCSSHNNNLLILNELIVVVIRGKMTIPVASNGGHFRARFEAIHSLQVGKVARPQQPINQSPCTSTYGSA
jgi:hypothetical protein